MNETPFVIMLGTVLTSIGMWLLLPRATGGRIVGSFVTLAGLGLLAYTVPRLADWTGQPGWSDEAANFVFWALAGITIFSAICAVSLKSPVYCAIWFALTLLATGGLFLLQGAQFLGVATVVVYAGAILVTFLFVLMLAQPQGHAYYDRISWEGLLSATTGAVMVGILTMILAGLSLTPVVPRELRDVSERSGDAAAGEVEHPRISDVLTPEHMAGLGGELFGRHLIAIEVAGVLLFVALVGAVAIVAHEKQSLREHSVATEGRSNG